MHNKPVVVIDFANNLIRIHKTTILLLGSPESILLIINPAKLTIGIIGCTKDIHGSHRINFTQNHCCELYSKLLVSTIKKTFPYWDREKSYKITGSYLPKERIACFDLSESIPLKPDEE